MSSSATLTIDLGEAGWLDQCVTSFQTLAEEPPEEITLLAENAQATDLPEAQAIAVLCRYADENSVPLQAPGAGPDFIESFARYGLNDLTEKFEGMAADG